LQYDFISEKDEVMYNKHECVKIIYTISILVILFYIKAVLLKRSK
jgi:hypothetical protein